MVCSDLIMQDAPDASEGANAELISGFESRSRLTLISSPGNSKLGSHMWIACRAAGSMGTIRVTHAGRWWAGFLAVDVMQFLPMLGGWRR